MYGCEGEKEYSSWGVFGHIISVLILASSGHALLLLLFGETLFPSAYDVCRRRQRGHSLQRMPAIADLSIHVGLGLTNKFEKQFHHLYTYNDVTIIIL